MSESVPPPADARRSPWGWVALGLLFAYFMFGAASRPTSNAPSARVERYTSRLQTALRTYAAGDTPVSGLLAGESGGDALRKLEKEVEPRRRTQAIEAGFWAVIRRHLGESVAEADLAPLAKDKDYAILAEAVRLKPRTQAEARRLIAVLEKRGAASRLAADHLRPQAGLPAHSTTLSVPKAMVAGLFFLALLVASAAAWIVALVLGSAGTLRALGPATEARTGADADRLATRAATVLVGFFALSTGAGFLAYAGLNPQIAQSLAFAGMLVVVPLALRGRPSMAEVGLSTRDFGRNVGLGLWAFLLEIPVTGGIAIACSVLLRSLPQPEHPASTSLMNSPDLLTVAATFFGGAIVAPFWEETMFRGLLFPALRQALRGPVPAALVSSFLFASIHPQGPVLWAALASVALFSCFLAQKTRSLVPSITMHLAHNTVLLALTLLVGG